MQATSSFPYQTVGPVDFSGQNFIQTEQTDFYYNASGTLISEVKQSYNPAISTIMIFGFIVLFLASTFFVVRLFTKRFR
jgi:hypothetical protein